MIAFCTNCRGETTAGCELCNPASLTVSTTTEGQFEKLKIDWKTGKMRHKFKKHKYKAKATEVDGIRFDSAKEARYYQQLKLLQCAGEVIGWLRQVPIHMPGTVLRIDFLVFYANGECKGVEVKGYETKTWLIKKRMLAELYPWFELDIV